MVGLGCVLVWMLLAWGPGAFALEPSLDISQYAHTSWKVRDGFFKGAVHAIAQTPDGYLWLGTEFGLVRFDGVKPVPWQPPADQPLSAGRITELLIARDGTLWIGTDYRSGKLEGGKLTQYPELAGQRCFRFSRIARARSGRVHWDNHWEALCDSEWPRPVLRRGRLGRRRSAGLYEDRTRQSLGGSTERIMEVEAGQSGVLLDSERPANGVRPLGEDEDGSLLIDLSSGITRFVNGRLEPSPLQDGLPHDSVSLLLRDRDGELWVATLNHGLAHLRRGRRDLFTEADGLSGNNVIKLFKDREGNIWAATSSGLDRFRDLAVPTFTAKQGLLNPPVGAVFAARDGSLWLGTLRGLGRWHNGQITRFGNARRATQWACAKFSFEDRRGRIWVSTNSEFGYSRMIGLFPSAPFPAETCFRLLRTVPERSGSQPATRADPIAGRNGGTDSLGRARDVRTTPILSSPTPWKAAYGSDFIEVTSPISLRAGARLVLGEGRAWHGSVLGFRLDPDGTLWVATEGGLSRLKGRIATLSSKHGLPCDTVHW